MSEYQDELDEVIDDALRTWPRAQTPHGFSSRVLQRIEPASNISVSQGGRLKFRLTWLDAALGLFAVCIPFVAILVWDSLPLPVVMRIEFRLSVIQSMPQVHSLFPYLLPAAGGFLALTMLIIFLFTFPATSYKKTPGH